MPQYKEYAILFQSILFLIAGTVFSFWGVEGHIMYICRDPKKNLAVNCRSLY